MAITASPNSSVGKLFLVGTPIGNLEDITLRALQTLKTVDLIACEDTRRTRKLLNRYQIKTPTVSYHEHNEITRAPELILELEQGAAVALVSDAGTPGLSDPGYRLVHLAIRHKIPIIPIPGVSALVTAISAAGLAIDRCTFCGFLPSRRSARLKALEQLSGTDSTLVFFEAPHRVVEMLTDVLQVLGDRRMTLAREMTKAHEEFLRGAVSEVVERLDKRSVKGEITLVIAPPEEAGVKPVPAPRSLRAEIEQVVKEQGLDERAALKAVARAWGVPRSELYRRWVREKSLES